MAQRAPKPRKNKPSEMNQVSSPGKVYHSRASKPSNVAAVSLADADLTYSANEVALINGLKAKMNELLAALKK